MNGKGDKSRVKDLERYRKNFDAIIWHSVQAHDRLMKKVQLKLQSESVERLKKQAVAFLK